MNINSKHILFAVTLVAVFGIFTGCKNREVNPESSMTREIHINTPSHFQRIKVGGIEYLILERDRNNPHEGFGFMAISGEQLIAKQDSIIAYQKTILENQARIISRLEGLTVDQVKSQNQYLLQTKFNEIPILPIDTLEYTEGDDEEITEEEGQ
ncbi:MAG: hypothetical protein NXI20_14340 [bacterium]|nr:hypothetical protein [bacterium]